MVNEDCKLDIYGKVPVSTAIQLYEGWNLVSYPSMTPETVANAFWGISVIRVEAFDPNEEYDVIEAGPGYVMQPGEGYWVYAAVDTVWVVDW